MDDQIEIKELWHKSISLPCGKCGVGCDKLWSSVKFTEWLCEECFEAKLKEHTDDMQQVLQ